MHRTKSLGWSVHSLSNLELMASAPVAWMKWMRTNETITWRIDKNHRNCLRVSTALIFLLSHLSNSHVDLQRQKKLKGIWFWLQVEVESRNVEPTQYLHLGNSPGGSAAFLNTNISPLKWKRLLWERRGLDWSKVTCFRDLTKECHILWHKALNRSF